MQFAALDTSQNSHNLVACLKDKGITAIGRYYTKRRTNSKILTVDEARKLSDAGIKIWAVYQNRHRKPVDFSSVKGKQEAQDALDYAQTVIKQPAGSAIYFSADFDASLAALNSAIRPHFEAIVAAFAAAANPYRIGVYSSGLVCKSLLDNRLVQLTWLSQSSGFRGTPEFKASRRWNILQNLPVRHFCNFEDDIDPDQINAENGDFGGFLLQAAQRPQEISRRAAGLSPEEQISAVSAKPAKNESGPLFATKNSGHAGTKTRRKSVAGRARKKANASATGRKS